MTLTSHTLVADIILNTIHSLIRSSTVEWRRMFFKQCRCCSMSHHGISVMNGVDGLNKKLASQMCVCVCVLGRDQLGAFVYEGMCHAEKCECIGAGRGHMGCSRAVATVLLTSSFHYFILQSISKVKFQHLPSKEVTHLYCGKHKLQVSGNAFLNSKYLVLVQNWRMSAEKFG